MNPWMPARLIPVAGIRGQDEQEIRAASSLLAVMGAVDEFGKALLKEIGAPRGESRPSPRSRSRTPRERSGGPTG